MQVGGLTAPQVQTAALAVSAARKRDRQLADAERQQDAEMVAFLLANGQKKAARELLGARRGQRAAKSGGAGGPVEIHTIAAPVEAHRGLAQGSVSMVGEALETNMRELDSKSQLYIAQSMGTTLRPAAAGLWGRL